MSSTRPYIVFLDIDGVLTSNRAEFSEGLVGKLWSKFDPIAVEFFNRIHSTYDVEFVLISTWRDWIKTDDLNTLLWVETAFRSAGFRGNLGFPNWKVNPENDVELWKKRRAHEIKDFLINHAPTHKDFLIFDDSDYDFNSVLGIKRFVKTDCDNGILFKHMLKAWSIMGEWKRK